MTTTRLRKSSVGDHVFDFVNYTGLILILIITGYPVLMVLSASVSDPDAVSRGIVWLWPVGFSLEGYVAVFKNEMIVTGYLNTLFYVVVGTVINLFMTVIAAYPLSRSDLKGGRIILFVFSFTLLFSGGLIPFYMLVKDLGMLDTRWSQLVPSAMSVFNVIIMRSYFQTNIPKELLEASKMDGCSDFRFLLRIVIPLSGPIIAVMVLFYGVGIWNSYFSAMIFLSDKALYPLQLVLREILVMNQVSLEMLAKDPKAMQIKLELMESLKYAVIIVANLPLFIAYPFIQKHFTKGIMVGSLKG